MSAERHPLAKARDEYLDSPAGKSACDLGSLPATNPIYLRNRIESAFISGWNAAEEHAQMKSMEPKA